MMNQFYYLSHSEPNLKALAEWLNRLRPCDRIARIFHDTNGTYDVLIESTSPYTPEHNWDYIKEGMMTVPPRR